MPELPLHPFDMLVPMLLDLFLAGDFIFAQPFLSLTHELFIQGNCGGTAFLRFGACPITLLGGQNSFGTVA